MRSFLTFTYILIFQTFGIFAAKCDTIPVKYNVSVCPQYLFNNGIKITMEIRLSKKDWVGISAELYNGPIDPYGALGPKTYFKDSLSYNDLEASGLSGYSNDYLRGFGFYLENKRFFNRNNQYTGGYFKAGGGYTRYNIDFSDYAWMPFVKNGNTYYDLSLVNGYLDIDKY